MPYTIHELENILDYPHDMKLKNFQTKIVPQFQKLIPDKTNIKIFLINLTNKYRDKIYIDQNPEQNKLIEQILKENPDIITNFISTYITQFHEIELKRLYNHNNLYFLDETIKTQIKLITNK